MELKMHEYAKELHGVKPSSDYLVAIDSDGCVFDAMGIKQRECFCPMMIAYFGLQPVAQAARECKEFADLFSKTRGANRHKTIVRILTELLASHPVVQSRRFQVPHLKHYFAWVENPRSLLSDAGLKKAINEADDDARKELQLALKWSLRVNELVSEVVKNIPPFPYVLESFDKITTKADIIVCSSTPVEALQREWAEHDILKYVKVIGGQEMGSKTEQLAMMCNKYDNDKILMIGDALGDQMAAEENDVLFYAINPGTEDVSWKRFHDEAFDKFISGNYADCYEKQVKLEFDINLSNTPPWLER